MALRVSKEKESSDPIIFQGATQSDLCAIFHLPNMEVKARLMDVRPHGTRNGYNIYRIRDVAARLTTPDPNVIERILMMHPNELPKMLSKEFWMGANHRLTYMQRTAELWSTKAVVELAGQAFKTLRLSLVLMADAVERESGLSPAQREIIARLVNTALEDMRGKLVDDFKHSRENSQGKGFAPAEAAGDTGEL